MRRMYSEQELTRIINEVIADKIDEGAFDTAIADAVDDYLVAHPVDITALEGQTIAPAVVNATTSMSAPAGSFTTLNGEANPSVKPIYCHPCCIRVGNTALVGAGTRLTCLIFNNSSTAFTKSTFLSTVKSFTGRIMASGVFNDNGANKNVIASYLYTDNNLLLVGGNLVSDGSAYSPVDSSITLEDLLNSEISFEDNVNKIN